MSNCMQIGQRLESLLAEAKPGFVRFSFEIELNNLTAWLQSQTLYPKIFWHSRSHEQPCEFAALGCLDEVNSSAELEERLRQFANAQSLPRYVGGQAFVSDDDSWSGFGACRYVLPELEVDCCNNQLFLHFNALIDQDNRGQELARIQSLLSRLDCSDIQHQPVNKSYRRVDNPSLKFWQQLVSRALDSGLKKVVLSRESHLTFESTIQGWDLFHYWREKSEHCFHFAFEFVENQLFMGCSPERLYRRHARQLDTEALAGTVRRTGDDIEDRQLAEALLEDDKNIRENEFVFADICHCLGRHASNIQTSGLEILRLNRVQHLRRKIKALLHAGTTDADLIEQLHPTPAVCGTPHEHAIRFISEHEPHSRGWYAGICGHTNGLEAEFTVAIRSALLEGRSLRIFAGAGIVEGSQSDSEWREIEAKIANLLSVLG